jgi:hypothetical protein
MSWTDAAGADVGLVKVHTTSNGGHPPEWFAEQIVERLIYVGDQAPQPIRDQARAYRDQMLQVVLAGIKAALASDRAYRPKG